MAERKPARRAVPKGMQSGTHRKTSAASPLDRMVADLGAGAPVTFIHGIGQGDHHIGEGSGIATLGVFRVAVEASGRSARKWEYKRGQTASVLRDESGTAILIVRHATL